MICRKTCIRLLLVFKKSKSIRQKRISYFLQNAKTKDPKGSFDKFKSVNNYCSSAEPFCVSAFSPLSGMFTFEEGEKNDVIYRICRLKNCGGEAPKGVSANGWISVCGSRNFYIAYNPDTETKNVPSYKFWQTVNRVSM